MRQPTPYRQVSRRMLTKGKGEVSSEVIVNGRGVKTFAATLDALVAEQEFSGRRVATALNGEFIPESRRATTRLKAGDKIEIVSPRQGG